MLDEILDLFDGEKRRRRPVAAASLCGLLGRLGDDDHDGDRYRRSRRDDDRRHDELDDAAWGRRHSGRRDSAFDND